MTSFAFIFASVTLTGLLLSRQSISQCPASNTTNVEVKIQASNQSPPDNRATTSSSQSTDQTGADQSPPDNRATTSSTQSTDQTGAEPAATAATIIESKPSANRAPSGQSAEGSNTSGQENSGGPTSDGGNLLGGTYVPKCYVQCRAAGMDDGDRIGTVEGVFSRLPVHILAPYRSGVDIDPETEVVSSIPDNLATSDRFHGRFGFPGSLGRFNSGPLFGRRFREPWFGPFGRRFSGRWKRQGGDGDDREDDGKLYRCKRVCA